MTDNMITWNVRNWITVVLMVMLGWLVIMGGLRLIVGKRPDKQGYQTLAQSNV